MTRLPTFVNFCGLGCMVAGVVTTGMQVSGNHSVARPHRTVRIGITAGPSLVGRPTDVTLRLSSTGLSAVDRLAVTDLLPPGLRYVAGSSTLAGMWPSVPIADPRSVARPDGTLLVWPSVLRPKMTADDGLSTARLTLTVRPDPAATTRPGAATTGAAASGAATGPAPGTAGSVWTDGASVTASRSGSRSSAAAPSLSAQGTALHSAADLVSTTRTLMEVVAVWAYQTGRVLPQATGSHSPTRTGSGQRLQESLTIRSTPVERADAVTARVYLPGAVAWAGCVTAGCSRPTTEHVRLAVVRAQPDRPEAAVPAALRPATTISGASVTTAPFTVLTWRLGTLRPGTHATIDYRIDAASTSQPRTVDVVTATATTATATSNTSARTASSLEVGAPGATQASPDREGSATVGAMSVQVWPAAPGRSLTGVRTTGAGARTGAATTTTSIAPTTTSTAPTTTTTTPFSTRNPFIPTTTILPTTTTVMATTTTVGKGKKGSGTATLATTGTDLERTVTFGLTLTGLGAVLLVAGRRRRPGRRRSNPGSDGADPVDEG